MIGHFHYVVAPGTIFALFAGIYYWFPKATGRKMNETLGKHPLLGLVRLHERRLHADVHQGLAGVSRRLYDGGASYAHAQDVLALERGDARASAWVLALAQIPFIFNFFWSMRSGKKVDDNPWEATTLEWAAPSPPPHGNFASRPHGTAAPTTTACRARAGLLAAVRRRLSA